MSVLLAAVCGLALAAAGWELAGSRGERAGERARRRLARALELGRLSAWAPSGRDLAERIERAGVGESLSPAALLAAKLASGALAAPLALLAAPVAPGRFGLLVAVGVPAAGFLAPDLLLERLGRRRRARIAATLPDALDLMAVGAASGRGAARLLGDAASASRGPLRGELAAAVAEIECGRSQQAVLEGLRRRPGAGPDLAALAVSLERSRRHGSPLAAGLHRQAGSLRERGRRRTEERGARAAPKMQLVVALLLVPSVLAVVDDAEEWGRHCALHPTNPDC